MVAIMCSVGHLLALGTANFPQSVASGDPLPDSVVLWTRLEVNGLTDTDQTVNLRVTEEADIHFVGKTTPLTGRNEWRDGSLTAAAAHDGVVKVIVDGLDADTYYYYQFEWNGIYSPVGRTKTAPNANSTRPIRFAAINCNDFIGRYYNVLKHLNEQEAMRLDFVVNLGDYIYETTGDPTFQGGVADRNVVFTDLDEAIELTAGDGSTFYAAKSVSNYRDIYKTIRLDPQLQRLHELYPMISIWDDHEFSDDRWRDVATFFDEKSDEQDTQRLHNSEQVWYEMLPSRLGLNDDGTAFEIDAADLYPNTVIYGTFDFGQNLRLITTDVRTFRPDHIIPEDAYPAAIVMNENTTQAVFEVAQPGVPFSAVRGSFAPYVDIDLEDAGTAAVKAGLQQIVTGQALAEYAAFTTDQLGGQTPEEAAAAYALNAVTGLLEATYINRSFAAAGLAPPYSDTAIDAMPRGVSYALMGKLEPFTEFGSRYQLIDSVYQLYAAYAYDLFLALGQDPGRDQDFLGVTQRTAIETSLAQSTANWPVLAASTPFTPIRLELAQLPDGVSLPTAGTFNGQPITAEAIGEPDLFPDDLENRILVNADEPIGFPNYYQNFIDAVSLFDGVIISGDIHAQMVGEMSTSQGTGTVADFTVPSAASGRLFSQFIAAVGLAESLFGQGLAAAQGVPFESFAYDPVQRQALLDAIDETITFNTAEMIKMNSDTHGYTVFEATETAFTASFRLIETAQITNQLYALEPIDLYDIFTEEVYEITKTENGYTTPTFITPGSDLEADVDGDFLNAEAEMLLGTATDNADSDGDGLRDGVENTIAFLNPLDGGDVPTFLEVFPTSAIRDLLVNTATVRVDGPNAAIQWIVEESTDLENWSQLSGDSGTLELAVPLNQNEAFIRLRLSDQQ